LGGRGKESGFQKLNGGVTTFCSRVTKKKPSKNGRCVPHKKKGARTREGGKNRENTRIHWRWQVDNTPAFLLSKLAGSALQEGGGGGATKTRGKKGAGGRVASNKKGGGANVLAKTERSKGKRGGGEHGWEVLSAGGQQAIHLVLRGWKDQSHGNKNTRLNGFAAVGRLIGRNGSGSFKKGLWLFRISQRKRENGPRKKARSGTEKRRKRKKRGGSSRGLSTWPCKVK